MENARDLSTRLAALLRDEQRAMADFLVALSTFDHRKLWRELGHASLFAYSRGGRHTPSRRWDERDPSPTSGARSARGGGGSAPSGAGSDRSGRGSSGARTACRRRRHCARGEASSPGRGPARGAHARLHLTVSRRLLEKLQAAKDALSHARPGASTEEILEAGLDLILAEQAKRRGLVAKPRNVARPTRAGAVPADVKREAWRRAGGRCEFRLDSGEVCRSTTRLELDHVIPRAHGGPSTIDNVRVTCREHNDLAARQVFGDEWMDRFRRAARPPSRSDGS